MLRRPTRSNSGVGSNNTKGLEETNGKLVENGTDPLAPITPPSARQRRKQPGGDPKRVLLQCCLCIPCIGLLVLYVVFLFQPSMDDLGSIGSSIVAAENSLVSGHNHRSESTLVTAYFPLEGSKYDQDTYNDWMKTMLSLQDSMIIYTTPEMKATMESMRRHAKNRTLIVTSFKTISDVPMLQEYGSDFWNAQLEKDPEKRLHKSYLLFQIWLSKPWFVINAMERNPFQSEYFVWGDIGCFRTKQTQNMYTNQELIQHVDVIPNDRVLFLAHQELPSPPTNNPWWTDKLNDKLHFYHSGTFMAGNKATWAALYEDYVQTLRGYAERDLFIGDDQVVMQMTCVQNPQHCAYITSHYFGLRYALFKGGKYRYWYPPEIQQESLIKTNETKMVGNIEHSPELKVVFFEDVKLTTLQRSPNTVVTAYFTLKSKFPSTEYNKWMTHMLSLQDAMVIFTSPGLVDQMKSLRSHAKEKTVIIAMDLEQVPLAQEYDTKFWENQLEIDPEKSRHQSYQLFWVWLSKSWFVTESIQRDYFGSDVYVWSDIGCFRRGNYDGKEMIQHREQIPRNAIIQMAHHAPNPPSEIWWNDKYTQKDKFYHSGSQAAGYKDTWIRFHNEFLKTVRGFVGRKMFMGEDQAVMQSTCLRVPDLCAYVPFTELKGKDNHYFGLRYVLHNGGNYKLWSPPGQ